MDKNYITMTIETPDGEKVTKKVRGLIFVAQSADEGKDNHTVSGSIGKGADLCQTMMNLNKAISQIKKEFIKESLDRLPQEVTDKLKTMMSNLESERPSTSNMVDNLSDILGKNSALKPLPRQKVVN